jgi:hypothetical protein
MLFHVRLSDFSTLSHRSSWELVFHNLRGLRLGRYGQTTGYIKIQLTNHILIELVAHNKNTNTTYLLKEYNAYQFIFLND